VVGLIVIIGEAFAIAKEIVKITIENIFFIKQI